MNKRFDYYRKHIEKAEEYVILTDNDNELIAITLNAYGLGYGVYKQFVHDPTPNSRIPNVTLHDDCLYSGDSHDEAKEAYELAKKGFVKCPYCGKVIALESARRYAPAGISCDNPECVEAAQAWEHDFLSNLD